MDNSQVGFVINPLTKQELGTFLDEKSKKILKYFIMKSLISQPEPKIGQRQLPIQVPKEHIEQWFTQALNVKPIGAGSYPIDIYNDREKWGADIKMLNIKINKHGNVMNSDSGEASLGQNFSEAGIALDTLFANRQFDEIKDNWVKLYKEKYNVINERYSVEKIYYFFILRPGVQVDGADFYFCGASVDVQKLDKVSVNQARTTKSSVFLDNFIAGDYGNTKIYKAKKRLELRLRPKKWIDEGMVIKMATSFMPNHIDLRDQEIDTTFLGKEFKRIQQIEIEFID